MADLPIDLSRPRSIHLVAIGGKAMAAMAEVLVAMGHRVSGSDIVDGPALDALRAMGASITVGHDPDAVAGVDLVACSTAVPGDDPERVAALAAGTPVVGRPMLQGAIVRTRRPVAISGTHGKTSTTAMVATIAAAAGLDASRIVGGDMGGELRAAHWGSGEWFVVEADESDGTFLELGAEIAVVTNVAADHLDQWGSLDAIEAGFDRFLGGATGTTIVGSDDPIADRLGRAHGSVRVGMAADADWVIVDAVARRGGVDFSLHRGGSRVVDVSLPAPGLHNARNAATAVAVAHAMGVDPAVSATALASYGGVGRRFELRGVVGGITVVDDYAHNPDKVSSALAGAAAGGWDRVVAVFQPHRYSRTADLWADFADSFVDADVVFVIPIDPVGEAPRPGVDGSLVAGAVRAAHPDADVRWVPERADVVGAVADELAPGDLCLTLGAGDITHIAGELVARLGERPT